MDSLFYLKKAIASLIMPLPLTLLIAFIALYFLYTNKISKAKLFFSLSLIMMLLFSYAPFSNLLLYPLESQYKKLQNIPSDVKYIHFLGGDRIERGWELLRIYNKLPNAKIIVSGYSNTKDVPEAIKTANVLRSIGIKEESLIILDKPKDTIEEAIELKKLLKDERFILITSAYHMPRAMMIFENNELYPIAAPADSLILKEDKFLSMPKENNFHKSKKAWHEYIGLLWLLIKS